MCPTLRSGKRLREPSCDDCAICLEGLPRRAKKLPCGHRLHGNCFQALEAHGEYRCPLCRGAFRAQINPTFDFLGFPARFQSVQETFGYDASDNITVLVYADTLQPVLTVSNHVFLLNNTVLILIEQDRVAAYLDDWSETPPYRIIGFNARTDGTVYHVVDASIELFAQPRS